ncbi:GDP-L-fucose synthase family protein [Leptospira kobayashii]|uniref:GDP-L-fucose synthase family protein n=1 Tax=Leptospira kobayashii TaxID=1917830 RepID=UPI000D59B2A2|nr:GDP-L-fucose synthase [Leptospira kobayashii]
MQKKDKIFISGHKGMVGSAFLDHFKKEGYSEIIIKDRNELDLRNSVAVGEFFEKERPDVVFIIAARVGGIKANMEKPADFIYDNLMIESNLIHNSHLFDAKKVIFFGSSCIYPRECPQPMKEEYLLTGPLEPTNEGYALAKISGLKMMEYYKKQYNLNGLSIMPSNLYGPGDSFHPEHSHVLSALVKKFTDATRDNLSEVVIWGTGSAKREFFHVSDLVRSVLFLLEHWKEDGFINVGAGEDISIKGLAELIANMTGYQGKIVWDHSKPDGMPRKCMDVGKLTKLGFKQSVTLEDGIRDVIRDYKTKMETK